MRDRNVISGIYKISWPDCTEYFYYGQSSDMRTRTLSAALVNLLEIDDAEKDGVVFGYEDKASYIGYSFDSEAYKCRFKQGESSFRFGSVEERDNIILTSLSHIDDLQFPITMVVDPEDFVIHKTVKLYRLNYHNPN